MSTKREFDEIVTSWLADGPDRLADRVLGDVAHEVHLTRQRRAARLPWRLAVLPMSARAAAAVIAVATVGGALVWLAGPGSPLVGRPLDTVSPSLSASPSPEPSVEPILPQLEYPFTSSLNGYSVTVPAAWLTTQATGPWVQGTIPNWGAPMLDELRGDNMRFVGTSQPIAPLESSEAWIQAEVTLNTTCEGERPAPEPIVVGGFDGVIEQNGCLFGARRLYDALIAGGGRGYDLTLDGNVTHDQFLAILATVTFDPASAFAAAPLPLDRSFVSPWYGYSVEYAGGWVPGPATEHWAGLADVDETAATADRIDVAGTDTSMSIRSQALPSGMTFDEWMTAYHANVKAQVAAGCDGGEPATWQPVAIGSATGRTYERCDGAEAVIGQGGRAYVFRWTNATAVTTSHFGLEAFRSMLTTITLDPASADDTGAN